MKLKPNGEQKIIMNIIKSFSLMSFLTLLSESLVILEIYFLHLFWSFIDWG